MLENEEDEGQSRLRTLSGQIIKLVDDNVRSFSSEEKDKLSICNDSMAFCMREGNKCKALWEAEECLKVLRQIIEEKDDIDF